MHKNIESIATYIFQTKCYSEYRHFDTNVKRWNRLEPGFLDIAKKNEWVQNIITLAKFSEKKKPTF